jgi:hypothetical protein
MRKKKIKLEKIKKKKNLRLLEGKNYINEEREKNERKRKNEK